LHPSQPSELLDPLTVVLFKKEKYFKKESNGEEGKGSRGVER